MGESDGDAIIGDHHEAPDGIIVEAPPPLPPVLDAAQEAQNLIGRNLKAVAISREHLLTHKPANPFCDA
eukprot:14275068-Heterocapsa_arctica.AAC.1